MYCISSNKCLYSKNLKMQTQIFGNMSFSSIVRIVMQMRNEPVHEISNIVVCATSKGSEQPVHTRRLIRAFASRLNILFLLCN